MNKSFVLSDEENPTFRHQGVVFPQHAAHADHGKVSLWGPEEIIS